jgi:hypothetical protein
VSKKLILSSLIVMMIGVLIIIAADEKQGPPEKNFFEKSLHYTANGLRYWYSKEQGGMETFTGVPIDEVNCTKCHVASCDACHLKVENGKSYYSTDVARSEAACRECHGYGGPQKDENGKEIPITDVHFKKGMKCMECHTIREIHGDGTLYNSAAQEGALDANCEGCHKSLSKIVSHEVHAGKLDCLACHVLERPSCHNCHFDTRIKEKKSKSFEFKNLNFLVNNKNGKVTLATMLTFVYQNKPMISFGPKFTHDVRKEGRKCEECHNLKLLKEVKKNKMILATYENGEMKNVEGVIPVLEGFNWNLFWMNWENEKWVPIDNPPAPVVRFSRYCTPLTQEQFNNMVAASSPKKKK